VDDDLSGLTKDQRKKRRRKLRSVQERLGGQSLDELATEAIDEALRLAPEVGDAATQERSERVLDLHITTPDDARYVRKHVNAALRAAEWIDEIEVWVWLADTHTRAPLTPRGEEHGVEVRMQQRTPFVPEEKPVNRGSWNHRD